MDLKRKSYSYSGHHQRQQSLVSKDGIQNKQTVIQQRKKCMLSLVGGEGGDLKQILQGTDIWRPELPRQREGQASLQGTSTAPSERETWSMEGA